MTGYESLLALDYLSVAKISSNSHFRQIFYAGYSSRLYMYLCIYNRYSDGLLSIPSKDNTVSPNFPNYSGHSSRYYVPGIFFSLENKTTKHSIGCHQFMIVKSEKDNK